MLPSSAAAVDALPPSKTRIGSPLLWLTLVALALRVAFVLLEPSCRLAGDEFTWTGWAWGAVEGLTSPRVAFSPFRSEMIFYPPLYAYFLAATRVLLGSLTAVKLAQALIGALLVPAVARVATVAAGRRAGLVAALCAAVYPELIWYSAHFWCETLFLTLSFWSFERLLAGGLRGPGEPIRASRFRWWMRALALCLTLLVVLGFAWRHSLEAGAGVALLAIVFVGAVALWWLLTRGGVAFDSVAVAGALWGLATLTRETLLYFAPVVLVWLLWQRRDGPARAVAFAIPLVLVVAPWTYRNYVVTHAFVPVATSGALNLWQGNTKLPREEVYALSEAVRGPGHVRIAQYRYHWRMALDAIRERQPRWLFDKLATEMPAFWEADSLVLIHVAVKHAYGPVQPATARAVSAIVVGSYLAVLLLALLGSLRLRLDRATTLLLGFLAYYNLIHVVTHGFSRYRLPVMPIVFCVAAVAVVGRSGRPIERPSLWRWLSVGLLAVALALSVWPSLTGPATAAASGQPNAEPGAPLDIRR